MTWVHIYLLFFFCILCLCVALNCWHLKVHHPEQFFCGGNEWSGLFKKVIWMIFHWFIAVWNDVVLNLAVDVALGQVFDAEVKMLFGMSVLYVSMSGFESWHPFSPQLPANTHTPREAVLMAKSLVSLFHMWESWTEFPGPGFSQF